MSALVTVETALLVVLVVLVAGLLRSHAAILRRLGPEGSGDPALPSQRSAPRRRPGAPAPPVAGQTPAGDAVSLAFEDGSPTLLAFLTSGCTSCRTFWDTLGDARLPRELRTVILTHDRDRESPSKLRELAPHRVPVVMSSPAWQDYAVPGSPYFVLVEDAIRGEGVATTWDALRSLIADARLDEEQSARGVDEAFAAAGIGPGDPSLYPGSRA